MVKQKILLFLFVTIFVLTGSFILQEDTAYGDDKGRVTVTVVDEDDNALKNAEVWYEGQRDRKKTNYDGEVTFTLNAGTYRFYASLSNYSMENPNGVSKTISSGKHNNVEIVMKKN